MKSATAILLVGLAVASVVPSARGGPYAPAPPSSGPINNGSTAIPANSTSIHGWATGVVSLIRGPQEIDDSSLGLASFGTADNALGPADATLANTFPVVSLGDGGSITLSFAQPITNGAGFDFAVYENGLTDTFLELAFVEVSTDGVNYVRFPSQSLTQTTTQVNGDDGNGTFGTLDPTDLNNLAGKYRAGYGTPFDLSDLVGQPGASTLDFTHINYVRIIDVVGWIASPNPTRDSSGRIINDPWATPYESSGFDLDAVAELNTIPEPGVWGLVALGACMLSVRRRRPVGRHPLPLPHPQAPVTRDGVSEASYGFADEDEDEDEDDRYRCAVRGGFTLVELLCVIAVIGILAVLILSGIPAIRAQSDATHCASNLRQLAAANLMYAGEHNGQYVPAQEPTNLIRWHGTRQAVGDKFDASKGPLAPYLGVDGRVKLCPAVLHFLTGGASFEDGTGGYGYNAAYIGGTPNDTWTSERTANVATPARTVMFTDTAFARANGIQEYAYCEPWQQEHPLERFRGTLNASVHFRHGDKANVAWCDGHVTAEPYTRLDKGNSYGGDSAKSKIGWFGPSYRNGYWRPY